MKRKRLAMGMAMALLLYAIGFGGLVGCSRSEAKGRLQIMFSGNLRGSAKPCGCHTPKGGIARWATFIKRHQDPSAAWLTVDAGNYVDRTGSGSGCSSSCQFLTTSFRDLHYDVLNLGKQEVWMGYSTLKAMLDTLKGVEFVSANLIDLKTKRPLAKPTVVKDYGGFRVGIIGVLNEADFPKGTSLLDTSNLAVTSYYEALKKHLPALKRRSDVIVLLCELPTAALDSALKTFTDIDLVISTGALRTGESLTTINRTRVVGPGSSGYSGHYATLELNPAWKDSVAITAFNDLLVETYDEQGEWQDRLAAFNNQQAVTPKPANPGTPTNLSPSPIPVSPTNRAPEGLEAKPKVG